MLHKIVSGSKKPNFMSTQMILNSQLNPNKWDELLKGYWDKQLLFLVRYGSPLDFDKKIKLESHMDNHILAK